MVQQEAPPQQAHHGRRHGGRTMTAAVVLTMGALGPLVLTGCTPPPPAPTATPRPNHAARTTQTLESPVTGGTDDGPAGPTPPPANTASQRAAVAVAEKFMAAFARRTLNAQAWINGLYPMLTQQAAAAYEDTDPANVPVHQVTGAGSVVAGSTDYALLVTVPTDLGVYAVSLTRQRPQDPWLVDRITPPQRR